MLKSDPRYLPSTSAHSLPLIICHPRLLLLSDPCSNLFSPAFDSAQDAAAAALVEVLRRLPPPRRRPAAPAEVAVKAPAPLPDIAPAVQTAAANYEDPSRVAAEAAVPEWDLALARGPRPAEVRALAQGHPLHILGAI